MYEDDAVGVALRDAHPPVDAESVWPVVLRRIRRIRRGRRVRRGIASLVAAVFIVSVVGFVAQRDETSSKTITTADDASPDRKVTPPIDLYPFSVAVGAGSVWVLMGSIGDHGMPDDAATLVRVDQRSGTVLARIDLRGAPANVAVDDTSAWVSLFRGSAVARIDLATNAHIATLPLELPRPVCDNNCTGAKDFLPVHIVVDDAAVWVSTARGYVARIDKQREAVTAMIETEPNATQVRHLAPTPGALLVGQFNIVRIDSVTNSVTSFESPIGPKHRFADYGLVGDIYASMTHPELGLWMTAYQTGQPSPAGVIGIDPDTGKVITEHVEPGVSMAAATDRIWARRPGEIFGFDPATGKKDAAAAVPDDAVLAIDEKYVWWIVPGSGELVRTTLATRLAPERISLVDAKPSTIAPTLTAPVSTFADGSPLVRPTPDAPLCRHVEYQGTLRAADVTDAQAIAALVAALPQAFKVDAALFYWPLGGNIPPGTDTSGVSAEAAGVRLNQLYADECRYTGP